MLGSYESDPAFQPLRPSDQRSHHRTVRALSSWPGWLLVALLASSGGALGGAKGEVLQLAEDPLTVDRKQADGRWLLAREAHTMTPVAKSGRPEG